MKKIIFVLTVALVLTMLVFAGTSYAGCSRGHKGAANTAEEGQILNAKCPVMGGEVSSDTPYRGEYKGKTIGLCCEGCVKEFKKHPKKYYNKAKKECKQVKGENCPL